MACVGEPTPLAGFGALQLPLVLQSLQKPLAHAELTGELVGSGIYTHGSTTDSIAAIHSGSNTAARPDRAATRASKGA